MNRLLITLVLVATILVPTRPTAAAEPQYFPETQHNLLDPMATYWHQHGGLPVFGFPISEAFSEVNGDTGNTYLTQYVERNRLESHPENAAPYHILLGLLGKEALLAQGRDWTTFPKADPAAIHYFEATGHAITHEPFWNYFRNHGLEFDGRPGFSEAESMALFGLPLSEPAMETNSSGDTVLTQWFERARFEFHPNNPAEYQVLLGLLGREVTANRTSETAFLPSPPLDEAHAAAMQLFDIFNQRRAADYGKPPVEYRHDIQADADRIARDWTAAWDAGEDDLAVLQEADTFLRNKYGSYLTTAYAVHGVPLTAQCNGVDPAAPIASGYAFYVAKEDFKTITFGVTQPFEYTCGKSISLVYIIGH